jgi:hypothetical protein
MAEGKTCKINFAYYFSLCCVFANGMLVNVITSTTGQEKFEKRFLKVGK